MRRLARFSAALALLACACTEAPAPPPAMASDSTAAVPAPRPAVRPDTLVDTLRIEGVTEAARFVRLDVPGVPFITYVPEALEAEVVSSGEGTGVRFVARFGGTPQPGTYVQFFFPSARSGLEDLVDLRAYVAAADGLFDRNGWTAERVRPEGGAVPCDWARDAWVFETATKNPPVRGAVCLGVHTGRAFYVVEHVPDRYAEGFAPRAARVLDAFRWRDDGTRLGGGAAGNGVF